MSARTSVASRESPPSAKKSSWIPTCSICRTVAQMPASVFSREVRGATKVCRTMPPFSNPSFAAKPTRFTFPVGPFGSSVTMSNLARDLEVGEPPGGEPTNGVRRRHSVGPQHDGRRNVLAKGSVGDGKGYGLCNSWMVQQYFIDFLGSNFFAAAIDNLACAAHKK